MNLIPDFRLDRRVVRADIEFLKGLGAIDFKTGAAANPDDLLAKPRCRHRERGFG